MTEKRETEYENTIYWEQPYLLQLYGCLVAPVGEIWWEEIHKNPSVDLYFEDRRHASPAGSRLVARVIFETLKENMLQK